MDTYKYLVKNMKNMKVETGKLENSDKREYLNIEYEYNNGKKLMASCDILSGNSLKTLLDVMERKIEKDYNESDNAN